MSYIGGASQPDKTTFTEGTTPVNPVGGEYNDSATTPASGQAAVARITSNRALHANLRKQDGTELATSSAPLRVDPTGTTTQPVSAASLPLPTGAATAAKQPALGTAGTASADVITVQGIASMTAVKVDGSATTQPVSGTVSITANSAVNVAQVGGTATDTNSGNKSAGTQRVVLATDQPQLTNALKVDGSAVTQPVSGTITANAGTGTFTNQQSNVTADYDTGAGTQTVTMFGIALPASGGSVAGGTATNPVQVSLANTAANATAVKVDGSAVTQPVSLASVPTHAVTQSGTWTVQPGNTPNTTAWKVDGSSVTQPVSGTVTATLSSTTNAGATAKTSDYDTGAGTDTVTMVGLALPASGGAVQGGTSSNPLRVDPTGTTTQPVSLASVPTHAVTQSGTWTVQPGNTPNTTAWLTQSVAGTSGGWSVSSQTALSNTKTTVKSGAANFGGYMLYNPNSAVIYIQVWDVASASVTVGTTAPTYVIPLPPSSGANLEISLGIVHTNAIVVAATTTATGATAPTTAIVGFFIYK